MSHTYLVRFVAIFGTEIFFVAAITISGVKNPLLQQVNINFVVYRITQYSFHNSF